MKEAFKYEWIYHSILKDIQQQTLKPGDKLPSIRSLSKQYKLSKTTVESAYAKLLLEGYIVSKYKSGYYVEKKEKITTPSLVNEITKWSYDFSGKSVDEKAFDVGLWKKYIKRALDNGPYLLSYGDYQGEKVLREALSSYAYHFRGIHASYERYVVSAGFRMLLFQLCTLFNRPVRVGMEEGFPLGEALFKDQQFEIIKIKSDKEGIDLEDLMNQSIDILYINPSKSGTEGLPLSLNKRQHLLNIASKKAFYLIEDDHNGELRYLSKPLPSLFALDTQDNVIYLGSFSKLLLPSIRLSYMILPLTLLETYHHKRSFDHQSASKLEQLALAYYIEDGQLTKHLKRLRKYYASKSQLLWDLIMNTFNHPNAFIQETALTICVDFKDIDGLKLIEEAKKKEIYIEMNSYHQCVFSYSSMNEERIIEAMKQLAIIYQKEKKDG